VTTFPQSREEFDRWKAELEARGFSVLTRWHKGLKTIRLGDIVLSEDSRAPAREQQLGDQR
jgi:hypothetical protein